MQPCTDLVIRARSGDRAALEPLFRAVQDDVYRLLLAELRHEADAEDAAQETFRQAVESIGSLRDPGAFPAWLVRIALEKARTIRRRGQAERKAGEERARRSAAQEEETMARATTNELGGKVRSAVEGLEPELRTAIRLRYEHGMTYEQIAEATDAPGGTVAWRLSEAHRKLQRVLAATGVAIAMAVLERELEAAPRTAMPERVASAVKRIAAEGRRRGTATPGGPSKRTKQVAIAGLAAVLAIGIWFGFRRSAGLSGQDGQTQAGTHSTAALSEKGDRTGVSGSQPVATRNPSATQGSAVLRGRVFDRDSTHPVPESEVTLSAGDVLHPGEIVARATSRPDGTYEISAPEGRWTLNVRAPGFVDYVAERYTEYAMVALSANPCPYSPEEMERRYGSFVELDREVPAAKDVPMVREATLSGQVVDEAGIPLPDVRVAIGGQAIDSDFGTIGILAHVGTKTGPETRSDSQGRFRLGGLVPAGGVSVQASREGYRDTTERVAMSAGDHETKLTMKVKPPVIMIDLAAVVLGPDGGKLKGAVVIAGGLVDDNGYRKMQVLDANQEGTFQAQLPQDTPWVVAWAPGRGIAVRSMSDRGAGPLDLAPPAADRTIRGCVVDTEGRPVPGALVQVSNLEMPLGDSTLSLGFDTDSDSGGMSSIDPTICSAFMPNASRGPSVRTAADGTFTLEGVFLPEGGRVKLVVAATGFNFGYADVKGPEFVEIRIGR